MANLCDTELKTLNLKSEYIWTIKNFSALTMGVGESLRSPMFSIERDDEQQSKKWHLRLYPKGEKEESKDFVALFLYYRAIYPAKVNVKFKVAIGTKNEQRFNARELDHELTPYENNWGWQRFIRRDILMDPEEELLPDDKLTILFKISVETIDTSQSQVPKFRLSDDMGALLGNGFLADCVLSTGDKEFQAHKAVLACRSPVFAAMFSNDTEEKRTNRVEIEDIPAPVLSQLLHFLYTGEAPKLLAEEGMAEGLLVAADKYQLDRLKALCEVHIFRGLNKDNVCAMLAFAECHNAEHLKTCVIEYICSRAQEVMESDGWRELVSPNSALLEQLFKALAANQKYS